jgi:formylmethanofuran dehydrogenase subunit E
MIEEIYEQAGSLHQHLCLQQVLDVRIGVLGGKLMGIEVPQRLPKKS